MHQTAAADHGNSRLDRTGNQPRRDTMLLTKSQLNKASLKELQQVFTSVKTEIARRENNNKAELLKKVKKMAAEAGVSMNELLGNSGIRGTSGRALRQPGRPAGKPRGKVAPKYKNPDNGAQTWTGRGRQPLWVSEAIRNGKSLESMLIGK